jgi:membrane fusion protein, copper/silver efflux system
MSWRTRLGSMPRHTRRIIAAAAVLLLAVGVTWALAAKHGENKEPRGQARPAAGQAGSAGEMSGMEMSAGGSVRLSADQIRQFGITFGSVEMRTLESRVRTTGTVTVDETRLAQVAPRFGGFVERLYVDATGQPVRRGQPLMDVYSPELLAAQQELLVARDLERSIGESSVPGVRTTSPNLLAAARRRLELWDVSDAQIEEILRTGKPRRALTLYAPESGVVLEKNVVQGQAIQPGQTLYTIANLSDVWITAELRETDAGAVRVGSPVTAEFAAYPGRPFTGHVAYVYPTLEAQARAIRARVAVPNPEGLLKPGMYVTVQLTTPTRQVLAVPTSAVIHTGERAVVFVDMGGGELMPHEVELGRTAGDYAEVLSGLEPGQRVVTSAQFLIDSESNLAQVMKSMIGQQGTADTGNMKGMQMPPERR